MVVLRSVKIESSGGVDSNVIRCSLGDGERRNLLERAKEAVFIPGFVYFVYCCC